MPSWNQPQWLWSRPSAQRVATFLDHQRAMLPSYPEVGLSRDGAPAGYHLDHNRVLLGKGESDFAAACDALRVWRMFPKPWTDITPAAAPIQEGQVVAMLAHALGFWWLNACRIVYVLDERT